jgi:hypothetical protein
MAELCPQIEHWGALGKAKVRHVHRQSWEEAQIAAPSKFMLVAAVNVWQGLHCKPHRCKRSCTLVPAMYGVIKQKV